ncbi:MAG TPA: hypothetical protein VN132_13815, partial [Bdellovibrio sp.]|nr:hypothetical protein [Bdellovibrio sp.]
MTIRKGLLIITVLFSMTPMAYANRVNSPDYPITHCYHWLNERTAHYLQYKYEYAAKNKGELTFYTTPGTSNGAVAGPGLYCAKTPIGSYTYGDRVIRIDFVQDIVLEFGGKKYCGFDGNFDAANCPSKPADVELYNTSSDWYVIKNPQAIASWSAYSDQLEQDLVAIKADGDSTANAHIDLTLATMKSDAGKFEKKVFQNGNQRMDLQKILDDPKLLAQIPPLSVISLVYAHPKIQNKPKHYESQFRRALSDSLLAFKDFEAVLKQDKEVKEAFLRVLKGVDIHNFHELNAAVVLAAIDKVDASVAGMSSKNEEQVVISLWNMMFSGSTSFDSLTQTNLSADGIVRKSFAKALPTVGRMSEPKYLNEGNIISLLKVMDQFATGDGSVKAQTEVLLEALLKSKSSWQTSAVYAGLKNPALAKEQALTSLLTSRNKTNGFNGFDPLTAGALFDSVADNIPEQSRKDIAVKLAALPLVVNDRLSYLFLEDLQNRKMSLPSFYDDATFIEKLIDRSIRERALGKNTTNTFRMILTGTFRYFSSRLSNNENKKSDKNTYTMDQVVDIYIGLAEKLYKTDISEPYAYIALQNAGLFAAALKSNHHPIEKIVEDLDLPKQKNFADIIATSIEPSLLTYLVNASKSKDADAKIAQLLLHETLAFIASPQFKDRTQVKNFGVPDFEKRAWHNVIVKRGANGEYATEHGASNLCAFTKTFFDLGNELNSHDGTAYSNAKTVIDAVEKSE